ncbi:SDR family NAD(P)-dependent oxidoreductase [Kocuria palustris]|uniref:SDR family NAD(P)-dependent oxidoreductase n=1 Tax=Kocuria palustris TaxID=71999 RepID=UPI00029E3792|nr:SDR family oxidoreductase [Kocuria palustris]
MAIVTGGSRGIGAAVVRRLAAAGHHVLLVYSQDDHDAAVTAEHCTTETAKVVPYKCDIAAPGSAEVVFDGAAQLGVPVILVNNAGVTGRTSSLADSDADAISHAVDVDLTATILLCREAVIRWTDAGRARQRSIVNLSSVAAKTESPGEYVWYAAAKAGVNALTVGLAVEAAPHGIRVNAVSPGTTVTTIHARAGRPDRATEVRARSPMGDPLNQRRSLLLSSGSSAPRPVTSTVRSSTSPEERDEPRISP